MSKYVGWSIFVALGIWLLLLGGAAMANHELGAPPDVEVNEFDRVAKVKINTQCPVHYVEYETSDYTAEAGKDYMRVSGRLTSAPWTFEVPILQDTLREPDEYIKVQISAGVTAPAATASGGCGTGVNSFVVGKITIYDDDSVVQPSVTKVESENLSAAAARDRVQTPSQGSSSNTDASGPAPVLAQTAEDASEAPGSSEEPVPSTNQAQTSTLRFVVIAGILGLGVSGMFAFSSRRNLASPVEETS